MNVSDLSLKRLLAYLDSLQGANASQGSSWYQAGERSTRVRNLAFRKLKVMVIYCRSELAKVNLSATQGLHITCRRQDV